MTLLNEPVTATKPTDPVSQLADAIAELHNTEEDGTCRCGVTAPCPTRRRLDQFYRTGR